MKRWTALLAAALMLLMIAPSTAAYTTDEPLGYPLARYARDIKLLGDAQLTDEGALLTKPLDGVAFYAEGGGAVRAVVDGSATVSVFTDAVYCGDVTLISGENVLIGTLPAGTHRVEAVLSDGNAVIERLMVYSSIAAVPQAPRLLVFDTDRFSVVDMMTAAHRIGMDCRTATVGESYEAADIVVTDKEDAAELALRYPHARVVTVGEITDGFRYVCEAQPTVLCDYLKETVVPTEYVEEIAAYVGKAQRFLVNYPPAESEAAKLRLEIAVAKDNDSISGVLYALHRQVSEGPRAAAYPGPEEQMPFNTTVLMMVVFGVTVTSLLVFALVMVRRTPKAPVDKEAVKEESE